MDAATASKQTQHGHAQGAATLALHLDSPFAHSDWLGHGFLGVWSPQHDLRVSGANLAGALHGRHWFLLAATEPGSGQRVHHDPTHGLAVAFDGYVVDPPLHHAAPSEAITAYWQARQAKRINGHFAAAIINPDAGELTLRTDAFSLAPLYYRVTHGMVLFGTNPDYLKFSTDTLDRTALASLLNHGFIIGDRTLNEDVQRIPPGGALTFTGPCMHRHATRFDLDVAGSGEGSLDARDMDRIQGLFAQAVERCLALDHGPLAMTLTAGLDSRRILGALLDRGERPTTLTVRLRTDGDDLDADIAGRMAAAFGLPHAQAVLPQPSDYARDTDVRRRIMGGETSMHDWAPTLHRLYPDAPATIFEGVVGDTLQEPLHTWNNPFQSPATDIEHYAVRHARNPFAALLSADMQRSDILAASTRDELAAYAGRRHVSDLAEIIFDVRRGIALASQMLRPRHLQVRPFLDLDFMQAILDVDPRIKHQRRIRKEFMHRFHPRLAEFAQSPDYVDRQPAIRNRLQRARQCAYLKRITRTMSVARQRECLAELLSPRGMTLCGMTRLSPACTSRWHWAMTPIFEGCLHTERTPPVWRRASV